MIRFRIILSLLVAAGAVLFALRHRSLGQLKTEQEQLRQQSAELSNLPAAVPPPAAATAGSTNAGLSTAERAELLRLRGQVGGLRQELAQATNQIAAISRTPRAISPGASDEPVVSRQEMIQKMNRGRQWILALILHANDHDGKLPATLAEMTGVPGELGTGDDFEFMLKGDLLSVRSPTTTIVLREKQPWKGTNGRWQRAYAFADGHVELASSDTGDFTEWERTRTPADPVPGP